MAKKAPTQVNFSKVLAAREALQRRAEKWAEDYDKLIEIAKKKGEVEAGTKAIQWAYEHMPADNGVTVIDQSIDKVRVSEGSSGPTIKIGFALGGLTPSKQLPPAPTVVEVIDADSTRSRAVKVSPPDRDKPIEQDPVVERIREDKEGETSGSSGEGDS